MPQVAAASSGLAYSCLPIHCDHAAPRLLVSVTALERPRKGCLMPDRNRDDRPDEDQVRGIASDEDNDFDASEDLDEEDEEESDGEEGTF